MPDSRPKEQPRRSVFRRVGSIVLKLFMTIFLILVIVFFLVQTPYIQDIIRGRAEKWLSRKLKTKVVIGRFRYRFPDDILLANIYLEDRQKDTLLSAGMIHVNVHLFGLLHHSLDIRDVELEELTVKVQRNLPDTTFNFQFIADAFAGSPSPKESAPSQPMKLSIGSLYLDKVRLVYKDTVTGNDIDVRLDHSRTVLYDIDPDRLRFGISSFRLAGLRGRVWQGRPLVVPAAAPAADTAAATQSNAPYIEPGKVELSDCQLDYRNVVLAISMGVQLGRLDAEIESADIGKNSYRLKGLSIDSTRFNYDDNHQVRQKSGVDYAHLQLEQLSIHGEQLSYSADSISGRITAGQFKEGSGFQLLQLKTEFLYTDKEAWLKGLLLRTPGTLLQHTIVLHYPSLSGMMKDPAHTLIDLDMPSSKVQVKDILSFVPSLRTQPVFARPSESWQLNARVTGSLAALQIRTLQFSGLQDWRLDLSGTVLNPLNVKRIKGDLDIRSISGSRSSLIALLPPKTIPTGFGIPEHFNLQGQLRGGMDSARANLVLQTSSGTVILKGTGSQFTDKVLAHYDATVQVQGLDLGYILQDTAKNIGRITASFTATGQGLDLPHARAVFSSRVDSANLYHYLYRHFSLDGSIADQQVHLQSSIRDADAISWALSGSADLSQKFPALKLDWQVDTLDLYALHLIKDSLQLHTHLVADWQNTNPDALFGHLAIGDFSVVRNGLHLHTDSILLSARDSSGLEDIALRSEFADLDWMGHYKLTEVPKALQATLNQYFHAGQTGDSLQVVRDTAFTAQDWTLQLHARPSPVVLSFMPSLKGTDTLGALVHFSSKENALNLVLKAPRIQLGDQVLQDVQVNAATQQDQLQYAVQLAGGNGSGFELHQTSLKGWLAHDQLFSSLLLKDGKGKDRYRLAGLLSTNKDGAKFVLNPDSLLLNYDAWQVGRDNFLQFGSAGILVHNFTISHKEESLQVNSNPQTPQSPIDIGFTDFKLSTLSHFADQDSLLVEGTLNGKAELKNIQTNMVFTSDLSIKGLSYKSDSIGDLSLKVNNEKANVYSADISLTGNRNEVQVKGEYSTGGGQFNMKLNLGSLNLGSLKGIAAGELDKAEGFLKGNLAISGTMDKPVLNGDLHFDSARITPSISGEPLRLSRDQIEFDADGFNFSQFSMLDSAGNKATIDGNVYTKNYRDFSFDITFNAQNFRLVNATAASDRQFYGQLNLDAAFNLEGNMTSPKVDGDLRVNKKTNFFFVLPGSDPEVADRQGVVKFVDSRHPQDTLVHKMNGLPSRNTDIKGMDVNLNMQTDSSAVFTVVIDERSGDQLVVRGRSNLVFGMDKSGKTSLTGGYEVEGGSYNLSLDVLKRKFDIQRGSTITWTGDPMTATLTLTATYTANTPSIDLIANEIAGRSQTDINKFKQKLPFLVTLKMEGELMKPVITFDISLPTDVLTLYPDVDAKLQQIRGEESELNKQVFALLLLNRFVGEDPLQSAAGGGSSVGSMAFQSASQILTNQLDALAGSLIKGVDIHFDLNNEQDFSTGTEQDYTELNVSVSKQLFNERVRVNVGSNFDMMGAGNPNQNASNIAGDVAVDYKLTKDGRYMLRAYRKNQYEAVLEGQVVETGVSFILTFDYDRFKDIFRRTDNDQFQQRKTIKSTTPTSTNE